MSAGLYRKQYEALKKFAVAGGVSVADVPLGSFNARFCSLCRIICAHHSVAFVPSGRSYRERKGASLRQVAEIYTGSGSNVQTLEKAAKALYDNANDGGALDYGSSYDWRAFQSLNHALNTGGTFTITEPAGSWVRTFNPNTGTMQEALDLLATAIQDHEDATSPVYTITEPSGGWLRTFDSDPADYTMQGFMDSVATVANEYTGTAEVYTASLTSTEYTFDPATDTVNTAATVLTTFIRNLQFDGLIG